MATAQPIASPFDGLQNIFNQILGSATDVNKNTQLNTAQTGASTQNTNSNKTENTNGTTATDALTQLLAQITGNTTSTTKNTADTTALQKVFGQQQAGITPEQLAAIFTEGQKAVPQLVATTANALGARSGDNSPLAAALRDMNTNLTSQAATINAGLLKDSGTTAAQIAQATGGTTTAGSTTQNNTSTTQANTNQTSQQQVATLLQQLLTGTQTGNTLQTGTDATNTNTGINIPQTAGAAGLAGLVSLLGNSGGVAGAGSSALSALQKLLGIGGTGIDPSTSIVGGSTDTNTAPITNPEPGFSVPNTDYGGNPYSDFTIQTPEDLGVNFKDGGIVKPKLLSYQDVQKEGSTGAPNLTTLMGLLSGLGGGGTGTGTVSGGETSSAPSAAVAPTQLPFANNDLGGGVSTPVQGSLTDPNVWTKATGPIMQVMGGDGGQSYDAGVTVQVDQALADSIGYKGDLTTIDYSGTTGGDGAPPAQYRNPDFQKYLDDNGYTLATRPDANAERNSTSYSQTFDKDGKPVGKQSTFVNDDDDPVFGLILGTLAALATGGAAAGLAAGAGVTGLGAAAATGAGAAFGGTAATTADFGSALKAGVIGGATGAVTGGLNVAGSLGATGAAQTVGNGVINGAINTTLKGGDTGQGAVSGGIGGGIKAIKAGWADGGILPNQEEDAEGIKDTIPINVSGGEAILPKDVVDMIGHDFIHSLIALHHDFGKAAAK